MKLLKAILLSLTVTITASAQVPVPNVPPRMTRAVHLAWDASPTPGVSYVLRRGSSTGSYSEMVELVAGTLSYVWTNAPSVGASYFVVSSKLTGITNGVTWVEESLYSNEVKSEPRPIVQPPALRTAVPITVEIYRGRPGQLQAKVLTLGPYLDMADLSVEQFSSVVRIGKPEQLLPE